MDIDVHAYLERIAFPGRPEVDLATLAALQRAHLGAVPFENLHVFHRRGVRVDAEWSVAKVLSGRGGWCFELNGAFAELLAAIGFDVDRVGASVLLGDEPPPEPDHLALVVHLDRRYLVDVGFGKSVTRPIPLDSDEPVVEDHGRYRLVEVRAEVFAFQFSDEPSAEFSTQHEFSTEPRPLERFADRSEYLATEQGLHWTAAPFATRLVPNGRVTLLADRLKVSRGGIETVTEVAEHEWADVLHRWFAMTP
jgi:N-hydroxyarylamine O-acetyltransferase